MTSRAIIAFDLDCFYASVAIRARPHLKDKPVVIVQKHLCVTSNYVARSRAKGAVQKMTPVSHALQKCPELVCIDGSDLTPFREASLEVVTAIRAWLADRAREAAAMSNTKPPFCACQRLGFDEVFIDVTELALSEIENGGAPFLFRGHVFGRTDDDELRRLLMVASQLSHQLREYLIAKTQLTLCAGISHSKQLAKLAVNMNKPNDQTVFLPDQSAEYLKTLSPRALQGFGHGTHDKIITWTKHNGKHEGIETVADVLQLFGDGQDGIRRLGTILGNEQHARHILNLCRGVDHTEVLDSGDAPKSISAEDSCRSCTTMEDVSRRLVVQITRLVSRLRSDGQLFSRRPRTLSVSYRFRGDGFVGTSRSVPMPTEIVSVCCSQQNKAIPKAIESIKKTALSVLKEHAGVQEGRTFDLTLLAVGASNFSDSDSFKGNGLTTDISEFFIGKAKRIDSGKKKSSGTLHHSQTPTGVSNHVQRTDSKERSTPEAEVRCPICNSKLSGDNLMQNNHIDKCLKSSCTKRDKSAGSVKRARKSLGTRTLDSYFSKRLQR